MNKLSAPMQARIPIGTVVVNGKVLDVTINVEWARFFEGLTITTNSNTAAAVNGKNGTDGVAVMLAGDGGESVEFIPGPPGGQGRQGDPGPPLFLTQDNEASVEFIPGPPGQTGQQGNPGLALFMLQESYSECLGELPMQPMPDISGKAPLASPTFTGIVTAPIFQTATSSAVAPNGVATTICTLPNGPASMWLVSANIGNVSDAVNYSAYAVIATDGATARLTTVANASLQTITLSGLNVQSTQGSGGTQNINMTITRIG